jgi:hypothetical protein
MNQILLNATFIYILAMQLKTYEMVEFSFLRNPYVYSDPRVAGAVKTKGQPEQYSAEDYYYA